MPPHATYIETHLGGGAISGWYRPEVAFDPYHRVMANVLERAGWHHGWLRASRFGDGNGSALCTKWL